MCADREFPSTALIARLLERGISFRLRVKADTRMANGRGEMGCAAWLFRNCPQDRERPLRWRRCLGQPLLVTETRQRDD